MRENPFGDWRPIDTLEAYEKLSIEYEKLLAKYNGVFEWVYNNEDQLPYLDTVDEIKTSYEESLK